MFLLMLASQYRHGEVVKTLLEIGAQVDLQQDGWSALLSASQNGHGEVVTILLENGAQVDLQNKHSVSVLMIASHDRHGEVVKILLENGDQVDLQDQHGWSALTFACQNGFSEIVKILINNGANVNFFVYNSSALQRASFLGYAEVVKVLLENGAQKDQQRKGISMLRITCQDKPKHFIEIIQSEVNGDENYNFMNRSPLILTGNKRHKPVKVIMHNGSQLNLCDSKPTVMVKSHEGHEEVEKILQDKNCKYYQHRQDDPVPFIITAKNKYKNKLIGQTAEICQTDGLTSLMLLV